jgi:hypothetical protein
MRMAFEGMRKEGRFEVAEENADFCSNRWV